MLKMYIENEGSEEVAQRVYTSKIMEDDKILVEFNAETRRTDFSCLLDRVGEEIMVYKNHMLQDLYVIESVERDPENEALLGVKPVYKVGIKVSENK